MPQVSFRVWQEGEWFLSEVIGNEGELYAQGLSYSDSLSNLFSVIKEMEEMDREDEKGKTVFSMVIQQKSKTFPKEGVSFSIPAFV